MKRMASYILVLTLTFGPVFSFAQQLHYTAKDAAMIHDSINHSRWDIGGRLSHYTFRYMSEFFPVGMIHQSGTPYQFDVRPETSIDQIRVKSNTDTLTFEDYLNKLHIASIIVVHKGAIVHEKYFSMLPEDRHTLQSITKVITSTLITSLANSGKIDIGQPIEKYIPELKDTDWQGITVREILDMRSGMDSKSIDFSTGPFTNPQHKNYRFESALGALPKTENTPSSVYEFIRSLKMDKAAGLAAEYSNINTFVLGWLAEAVTGKKYQDLVSDLIWMPMGASSGAYVCLSDHGEAWSHGGMSATLRDLARFGMLFTKNEIRNRNESLVSFAQINEIFDAAPIANSPFPFKWAYQWDLASDGMMMKGGFGGQALIIHPEKEIVIAYFNFVDKDWGVNNIISDHVIQDMIKAIDAD